MFVWLLFLALLLSIIYRKKLIRITFPFTYVYLEKHPSIGKALGVQYVDSTTWTASRKTAGLHLPKFLLTERLMGANFHLGEFEFIKSFRNRQRNPVKLFEINLPSGRRSFRELERELVYVWHEQLRDCYEIPIADEEALVGSVLAMRSNMNDDETLLPLWTILTDKGDCIKRRHIGFKGCTDEEKVLYLLPFLTTMDTFMMSLAFERKGDELKDYFDKVPIKFVPMYDGDDVVIVELKNNGQNNPGNSVFGPKGVVCPGSNVTTDILKAMKEFTSTYNWEIEGIPQQHNERMIAGISNLDDIFITIN